MTDSKKILKGLFYTLGSGYVARAASVVLTFLIRRELGTGPFDATVWATVVFVLLANLSQFGLIHSLLHYQEDVDQFVRTHFTISLIIGLTVFLVSACTAYAIDYADGSLGWTGTVILVFSSLYFFRMLSVTPEALLRKDFEHRSLSLIHGLGTIAALAGTFWLARSGAGAWSLVIGGWSTFSVYSVVYIGIFVLSVWILRPVKIRPLQLDPVWARRILSFGAWVWLSSQLQNFVWFYDKLVMPYFVTATDLTLYENTWWLMQIPAALITHVIMSYTVTVYAKVKGDRDKLSLLYTRAQTLIVRVSAPAALLLVVNADPLVSLMGASWSGSIPIFVWLAPYAFMRPLIEDGFGLLWAIGETRSTARVLGFQVAVALAAVPLGAWYLGVEGVAYAVGLTALIGWIGVTWCLSAHIDLAHFRIFAAPVAAIGVSAIASYLIHPLFEFENLVADLLGRTALTSLVYLSILWIVEKQYLLEILGEMREIMSADDPSAT
jgi:PST family polysaccharide transporter